MSRLSEKIYGILKLSDSSKLTDKKKCVNELLDLYQNNDAVSEICRNTERKASGNANWPCIMYTAHKLVLDEAERLKETITRNAERQTLIRLVINTIRLSHGRSARSLLKSSDIVSMILQILDSKVYTHYQDTYLGILVRYVLPKSTNHNNITAEQWKDLLTICTKLYKRAHLQKHIVLDALQMIVDYSFLHVNLLLHVKNLLLFLENVVKDVKTNDEQLMESICKLSSSVCVQIATESRITICRFSENILTDILCLSGSEAKYKLLLFLLQIHHPGGISDPDDGAYAYNWNKWRDLLRSMCLLVHENCKLDVQWYSFIQFASEVIKQIMDISNSACSLDASYSQPFKRRRVISRIENVVDLITGTNPEEMWPLLRILTEMLRKYPQCLKPQDLAPLLQRLTEFAQSRDNSVMDYLYNLAAVLMENRISNEEEAQDATIHWSKIWDMLLRSLGANQNEESGHSLIRCFIRHNRMPNANALLRLYLTKTIRWSPNSVHTLRRLGERVSLPEDAVTSVLDPSPSATTAPICDRTRLLEWLLHTPWQKLVTRLTVETAEDMCALLGDLVLSSRCRQNIRTERKYTEDREEAHGVIMSYEDVHTTDLARLCYASLTLKVELSTSPKGERVGRDPEMMSGNGNVSYVQEVLDFLKKRLHDAFEEESGSNDESKNAVEIYVVVMKIALLARALSALKQMGILTTKEIVEDSCLLIDVMGKHLRRSFEILAKIDWTRCKYTYLLGVTRALSMLYGTAYDADIANIIVTASTIDMLKNIFDLLNLDDAHSGDYYEEHVQEKCRRSASSETSRSTTSLPREGAIRLQVVKSLASFCALRIDANRGKSALQTKMMENLLNMQLDFTSCVDSRISLTILESLAKRDKSEIRREYANTPLEFLLEVCRKDRKDEESSRRLLNLLPYFFEYATEYGYTPIGIVHTLSEFYKFIHKRNCGVPAHVDYMRCVCNCVRIDPNFSWNLKDITDDANDVMPMLNSVLKYIGNALFVLRSQAVRYLQELLSVKNIAHEWKEQIFIKVEEIAFKLLDESTSQESTSDSQSNDLEESQQQDERETRTATTLITLASVACTSGVLQGRALCSILRLTMEKKVDAQKMRQILSTAAQYTTTRVSLIEDNLNYLLTSWLEDAQYPLQKFPCTLVDCETMNEFFKRHVNYIVPILLRTSDIAEVVSFCANCADVTFESVVEDVLPSFFAWLLSRTTVFDSEAVGTLRKLTQNTDEFANTRDFGQSFHTRLQDILVELIRRLHDESDFARVFSISGVRFPTTDPPHFSRAMLNLCFDHLESRGYLGTPDETLTRTLVVRQPAVLQGILLRLVCAVHTSRSHEGKLKRLHQYAYFCSLLMRDLTESVFDEMAAFLVRDVCYSLLHLTRCDGDETLVVACCKFLNLFLRRALPARAAEVRDVLRFVVANLIDLAQSDASGVKEIAVNLLRFLVVEQRDALQEAIAKLGSFPNHEIFREVRKVAVESKNDNAALCLEDELERFLDAMSEENAECTLEDLANLTKQLSTRKKELRELHRKLERPYLEEGVNILHLLIIKLVKLSESSNTRVSMEATRCLSELGPMDSTVALRPTGSLVREAEHAIEALTYRSVAMLANFLVENAVELRKVSADALYAVLSTSYGRKLFDLKYLRDLSNVLECAPLKLDYIRPFARGRPVKQTSFCVDTAKFRNVMDTKNALWSVQNGENYADWIVKVTCSVAECFADSYLENFLPLCRHSVQFCEVILPRIVYLVVHRSDSFINAMCNCVNQFFRHYFAVDHEITETTASPSSTGGCDRKIVRCMLDIVNHVRAQLPDGASLNLDYVHLARAAHKCSAYYTALLFAQLACESISTDYSDFSNDPKIDYIYEHQPDVGRVLQNIMLDTYLNISDPDAICGAGSSHLLDHDSRVQYYARTNCWDKVILAQDIELSHNGSNSPLANARAEMANALHRSGLQFLQWQFVGNCLDDKFSYECAWRLSNWNLLANDVTIVANNDSQPQQLRLESLGDAFHMHHYHALKCFHENDRRGTEWAIENARKSVIRDLRAISLESSRTVNEKLSQLRLLREIEQLSTATDSPEERYPDVLRRWNDHAISLTGQFDHVEPILWQRIVMFRIRESLRTNANMREAFFATCLNLAEIAESQRDFSVADRALSTLNATHRDLSADLRNQLLYQESLLAWMKGDQLIARRLLRNLIEKRNSTANLKAKALRVYGDWMAETKSENSLAVIRKYYLESIEINEAIEERTPDVVRNLHDTQVALARFADAQYEQISAYMNSPIYESLKEYARVRMDPQQITKNQDVKRAMIISQKQSTNDAAELKNIEQEKRNYLALALKYYLRTLQSSEEHNLLVFRLVALWLDNMLDDEVNVELLDGLDNVPSFKFVLLVPQLAAHVSNDVEQQRGFSARIFAILKRCSLEHPYHTLPVVLALKNLHSDDEYDPDARITEKEERRVLGAKKLLNRLIDSPVRAIVQEMENLSRALLSLAYWKPKGKCSSGTRFSIPRNQPISKIRNLNNVLLPTLNLSVRPSGNYDDVVGVRMYQDACEFVGGITAPKKIICIGTDGVQRRQLIKGKDDLRQDAVMQQVFTVMNTLLLTCEETKRRNLRIRTYKVVPLTQRSGVLEWCDNTVPITMTLVGGKDTPGMHKKYYPRDLTAQAARERMMKVAQESNEIKLRVFLDCCKRMRPAFHHFFEEKYRSPETWVERTLTYTRSVATTSIAGYILGLGDRHLSNILIDERTAEVVHIDFGIAFEQGRVLPFPETIPFRLTRDLEVAMGASGIEGTMRRSCEVTMTMLHDQRQIIITLLQVLLYDPLFTWAITPEKAYKMQGDFVMDFSEGSERASVETNKIAKRALLRIEQKLRGTEDGLVTSVPGQVERLLQEARDPANLCRVYCGWQPYL